MSALALASVRDLSRLGDALPWKTMDEFPDFYCAGWTLDRGVSPYAYEPLHACEHRVSTANSFRARLFRHDPAVAVPAPQPPYDFPPFMALAVLPFEQARAVYGAAILIAVVLSAAALWGAGIALDLAAAALLLSTGYTALNTAQIVPFSLLALALCGLALARGRDALAGIAAALTAIEPSAGLPVFIATILYAPRARWSALATALALALVAWRVAGGHVLLTYLTAVLPAHAASEVRFPFQYSLTYALAELGSPPELARLAGAVSYVALLAAGLWIACDAQQRFARREFLVFIPALCAVIAGPFLHQEELCFALPAALALATRTTGLARTLSAAALCALSVPWIVVWGSKQLFLASLFVCAVILLRLRVALPAAALTLCSVGAAIYALELHPPHLPVPPPSAAGTYAPSEIVEREWQAYTSGRSTRDPLWFVVKIPSWAALLTLLGIAAGYGRSRSAPASADSGATASTSRRI
jgi:hypothetical protein